MSLQLEARSHMNALNWKATGRYLPGYFIGSEGDDGQHLRDQSGWPYSIYKRGAEPGVTDFGICTGVQSLGDAAILCALLNAREGVDVDQF